jgi:hypothetical protein
MELTEIWKRFTDRMAEIELFHRAAKDSAQNELKEIQEYANLLEENSALKELSSSLHNMMFYDARTGLARFYHHQKRSIEERVLDVLLHKNKQYQWLLAEAYEEFEDYLENVYAYCGIVDKALWPLQDYGNISLMELPQKDFPWFAEQAGKKKRIPYSILKKFRIWFPQLESIEVSNKFNVNLRLAITLIEKLRHIIVHRGGKVANKSRFVQVVTEACGLFNNGNISQEHLGFITSFFGKDVYTNVILLLEIRIHPEVPIDIHVSLFEKLTGYLMAYAFLIFEEVDSHQSKKNA